MTEPTNCPFCSPYEQILLENDYAQVVLSDPHKVPGHLLAMPKRHIEKPWELTHRELTSIFDLVFELEQKLIGKLGDGFDIRQSYRPFRKQDNIKLDHVVFHVLPRSNEDYIFKVAEQYEKDLYADLDDMERDAVVDLLT